MRLATPLVELAQNHAKNKLTTTARLLTPAWGGGALPYSWLIISTKLTITCSHA